jgi:hypothetical protein
MAGQPMELLTGGAGVFQSTGSPSAISAPQNANGALVGVSAKLEPHHGVIGIVLLAVLVLFILDRAGFRFAVTAGRR